MYTINYEIRQQYQNIYKFIYHSIFICSFLIITFPVWSGKVQNKTAIAVIWNLGLFYILAYGSSLLAIISNFSEIQVMIMILNLVVLGFLFRWQFTLCMTIFGILSSIYTFKIYTKNLVLAINFAKPPLNIIYSSLLIAGLLVAFNRSKQELEEKNKLKNYLKQQNANFQLELLRLFRGREEFVNRLENQCIEVFKSIYNQIHELDKKMVNIKDLNSQRDLFVLFEIIKKLNAGAKYLDELILSLKNKVIIKKKITYLIVFIEKIIQEYKMLINKKIDFIVEFKNNIKSVEIDEILLTKDIVNLIQYGVTNSESNQVNLLLEDSMIHYDSINKLKTKAIKIDIIFDLGSLSQNVIKSLIDHKWKDIEETKFIELYKNIYAHYGSVDIFINKDQRLVYSLLLPTSIKEMQLKI